MELYTLGRFGVAVGGERIGGFRSRTAEALLVYLACHGRPLPRERLAELFWPERPVETSQANLRMALHRLHHKLEPYLDLTRQAAGVRPDAGIYLDASAFERLLHERRLAEALSVYEGDFLDGFHLDKSPAFEAWAEAERARLRELAVAALQELIAQDLAQARMDEALARARRLLELEPFHEPTHRILMRLLAQAGNRRAALAHFEACRQLFADELGLGLEPATVTLFEEIQRGEVESDAPAAIAAPARSSPHYDLPPTPAPLLGRWVELEGLMSRLENPDCRLVTVSGPGGIGKTRLALQAALDAATAFPDGVCFVPLAGVTSPEAIAPSMVQSLSLTLPPRTEAKAGLLAYLQKKRMLLVLDNFEQLLGGSLLLVELLRHAPHLKLLVTSRERLSLSEEWLFPLAGLRADEAAVALFIQSAERVAPEADLSGEEATIRDICALVEGFPLAIELAASWAGVMRPASIAQEVRTSLDFLNTRLRDLPERHRSVRGLFDASWRLLEPEEQQIFARLSVFRGGFTQAEAAVVAGASFHALRALVDKSLLRATGQGRFELHELLRQYTYERLATSGEAETTARRHFEAYLALAEEGDRGLFGAEQPQWLKRLEAESDNFRAALAWGFAHAEAGEIVRLVAALSWFWRLRAFGEARAHLERALLLAGLEQGARALLLYHRGHLAWMRSDYGEAAADLTESLALWDALGLAGSHTAARARCSLAMTCGMQRSYEDIPALLEPALEVFRAEDDPWWTAFARGWLGKAAVALGDLSAAKTHLDECLVIYRRLGNPWGLGLFLGSAADLHLAAGDLKEARALAEEGYALLREVGHKHGLGAACWTLGLIAKAEGRMAAAQAHFEESLALYRELGSDHVAEQVASELAALTSAPDTA